MPLCRCGGLWQGEWGGPSTAFGICDGNFPILQEQGGDIQGTRLSSGSCDLFALQCFDTIPWNWIFYNVFALYKFYMLLFRATTRSMKTWGGSWWTGSLKWVDFSSLYNVPISWHHKTTSPLSQVQESFELNHETLYTAVKMVDLYLSKKQVKIVKEATIEISLCKYFLSECSFVKMNVNQHISMKVIPKCFNMCPEMKSMPWPGEERGSSANWSGHLSDLLQGVYLFSKDRWISASTTQLYSLAHGCRWMSGYRRWLTTSFMSVMTPIRKDFEIT